MPKKIRFESFRYQLLRAAEQVTSIPVDGVSWPEFVGGLDVARELNEVVVRWNSPRPGSIRAPLDKAVFYVRGDSAEALRRQERSPAESTPDPVAAANAGVFTDIIVRMAETAGFLPVPLRVNGVRTGRIAAERSFHDTWAGSEHVEAIDVRQAAESCTAPEMRFITRRVGSLSGKRLLDVGCGLGEASVHFALRGATVTAVDLSQGMLDAANRLAAANGVAIRTHLAAAEDLCLPAGAQFDVIYAGNLLHHVDVAATLGRLRPYVAPGGMLVTWDPLAYNPAINVYRAKASEVRTPDEHPLRWRDIREFRRHFQHVETTYFWLTTLLIFVIMALGQRRDPNKERYWKSVVREGDRWAWLYRPLESLDRVLLFALPPLRLLCWNVVVICRP
jgi:SAM-dependent methyltransferase